MIIFFLLTALFATVAVTIAAGLIVLVVYLLKAHRNDQRQIAALNTEVFWLSCDKGFLLAREQERANQQSHKPLFVRPGTDTMH